MSEKRKQTGTSPLEADHKRAKRAINSVVKEYVCPIALELPVDPVTAEDGRVYNRAEIQMHINNSKRKKNDGSGDFEYKDLKSPMTKEPMGPNLFPAIQVRNSIRALIQSGAIEGDEGNVDQWKEVDDWRTKAEGGDTSAMVIMSGMHHKGNNGFIKDDAKAYMWMSRAADLDCTMAIATKGLWLLQGVGTEENKVEGGALIEIAADRGRGYSQHYLGHLYCKGSQGYTKNFRMAKYWLQKAIAHEGEWFSNSAKKILESIKEEEALARGHGHRGGGAAPHAP